MSWRFRRNPVLAGVAASLVACLAVAYFLGVRVNRTPSFPMGLYRLTGAEWGRGDLVFLRVPPDRSIFQLARSRGYLPAGFQPGGYSLLLKRVVAVAGDKVEIGAAVSVNGRELSNSQLRDRDSAGRPIPHEAAGGVVPAGFVWVMSEYSPFSFDSRYFGPLPASLILGRARPLWTAP